MSSALATPIKITIPTHGDSEWVSSSPTDVSALVQRLQRTPAEKSPEHYDARDQRARALAEVEIEAKKERAHRANERVGEGVARKLRLEAAAVQRAKEKLDQKSLAKTSKQQELEAKREASAKRSNALFEAVRAAREERQISKAARIAALAELESRAAHLKSKHLQSTVAKSAAQVRHASQVVALHKEAERQAKESAATELQERLEAASERRQQRLSQTVAGAASVVAAAERTRLRKLYEEKTSVEERRARLSKAMEGAFGRRHAALDTIKSRAAAENARIASTVDDVRKEEASKPAALAHSLAVKMQAAEVAHHQAMKQATDTLAAKAAKKKAVLIVIPANDGPTARIGTPPQRLLERLMFTPRMLLATSAARQAAAAGRRKTIRALRTARAAHFGTVRVALVRGRRSARAEIVRSLLELRERSAAKGAEKAMQLRKGRAAKYNQRVIAAKLRRSGLRLELLNNAIVAESKRESAGLRRSIRIQNVTMTAKSLATKTRVNRNRQAAAEACEADGVANEYRVFEASTRRTLQLAAVVAKAKRTSRGGCGGVKSGSTPAAGKWQRLAGGVAQSGQEKGVRRNASAATADAALLVVKKAVAHAVANAIARNRSAEDAEAEAEAVKRAIAKAAAISEGSAAKAAAKVAAKAAEAEAAAAVGLVALQSGLHGASARRAAEAGIITGFIPGTATPPSVGSSTYVSEEWQVVPPADADTTSSASRSVLREITKN